MDGMDTLSFRPANHADIPALVALVTSAYRGDVSRQGWTTEADLLDGQRIDPEVLARDIGRARSRILVAERGGEMLACAHVAEEDGAGYFGMFLQGAALLAIGLMMSSFTDNQIVAFFGALAVSIFFFLVDKFLPFMPSGLTGFFEAVSFDAHFESMRRGVLAFRDVIFFVSVAVITLMVAYRSLESRRWS